MADTSLTFTQLIALFADNTSGAISEQDLRNLVTSIFQYGGLRMPLSDVPAGQTIGTSFVKINQFTETAGSSEFVTPSEAADSFTIVKGGTFAVLVALSFSGSNNSTWQGTLFNNSADVDKIQFKNKLSSSGDIQDSTAFDCLDFADGDVIDFRVKADGAAKDFVMEAGSFFLFRIS